YRVMKAFAIEVRSSQFHSMLRTRPVLRCRYPSTACGPAILPSAPCSLPFKIFVIPTGGASAPERSDLLAFPHTPAKLVPSPTSEVIQMPLARQRLRFRGCRIVACMADKSLVKESKEKDILKLLPVPEQPPKLTSRRIGIH